MAAIRIERMTDKTQRSRADAFNSLLLVLLASALILSLSACLSSGGGKTIVYSPPVRIDARPDWPAVNWSLVVGKPLASEALDSSSIAVRPQPGELQAYADAQWSDPAPEMLQTALVQAFEDSGKIASVGRQSAGLHGEFVLLLDLRRFESVYEDPSRPPSAMIEVQAKLLANAGNRVLATRNFLVVAPARDKEIPQVVEAFRAAMTDLVGQVVGWTLVTGQASAKGPAGGR
jgi:cholesterol transport system auxiliary component